MSDLRNTAARMITNMVEGAEAPCVTSSFQAECMVLVHMLREVRPDLPVLFLDTVHHFQQTYEYRDQMVADWGLNLVNLKATRPEPGLWDLKGTDACCKRHKVEPLFGALDGYDTWFTALRRDQSPSRANLQKTEPFRLPSGKNITRVSPLATWTTRDVGAYVKEHDIPLLSLYDNGYTSIGCEPCTQLPTDPLNPRSGRWQGQKLECGIHVQTKD